MNTQTTIYSLSDPRTSQARYIGKTITPLDKRLKKHLSGCYLESPTHKNNWIKSLLSKGLKPTIEEIDVVGTEEWEFWEIYWIAQMKAWGFNLTNTTKGGGGYGCKGHSVDVGKKISEAKKGVKFSEEHKRNMSLCRQGSKNPRFGTKHTAETKAKMSATAKKRKNNPIHDKEFIRRKALSQSKPIIQYGLDGNFIANWTGIAEAVRVLGLNNEQPVRLCLKGSSKQSYGFIWKYKKLNTNTDIN